MKWPSSPFARKPEAMEAFVICEKGKPAVVVFNEDMVRKAIAKRDRRVTQIHKVPVIMGTN